MFQFICFVEFNNSQSVLTEGSLPLPTLYLNLQYLFRYRIVSQYFNENSIKDFCLKAQSLQNCLKILEDWCS